MAEADRDQFELGDDVDSWHVTSDPLHRRRFLSMVAPWMAALCACPRPLPAKRLEPEFIVTSFGARGNGVADDTRAFLDAIDAARSARGTVRIPQGHYLLNRTLAVPSGVHLAGEGTHSLLDWATGVPFGLSFSSSRNAGVSSLAMVGTLSWVVLVEHASRISVDHCRVSGGTVDRAGYCGGVLITDSSFVRVADGIFTGNGPSGAPRGSDIQCNGFGAGLCSEIDILRNRCFSHDVAFNICCFDSSHVRVVGNQVSGARTGLGNNEGYGITIYATEKSAYSCHDNRVVGNDVWETQGSGIYLVRPIRSCVSNNRVRRVGLTQKDETLPVGGIVVNDPTGVSIEGNEIDDLPKTGIAMSVSAKWNAASRIAYNCITRTDLAGIHLRGRIGAVEITSNQLSDVRGGVIGNSPLGQTDLVIVHNQIHNTRGVSGGIVLSAARRSRVAGNDIAGTGSFGIDVGDPDGDLTLTANRVADSRPDALGRSVGIRIRKQK